MGIASLYRYELREIMAGREIQNLVRRDSEKPWKSAAAARGLPTPDELLRDPKLGSGDSLVV